MLNGFVEDRIFLLQHLVETNQEQQGTLRDLIIESRLIFALSLAISILVNSRTRRIELNLISLSNGFQLTVHQDFPRCDRRNEIHLIPCRLVSFEEGQTNSRSAGRLNPDLSSSRFPFPQSPRQIK